MSTAKNYAETSGSHYRFVRDKGGDIQAAQAVQNYTPGSPVEQYRPATPDGLSYRTKWTTAANGTLDVEIHVPLKYLSNFWRTLEMPLINTEVNLLLTWTDKCILGSGNLAKTFKINDTKLYVPVVTLSAADNAKFLPLLKSGFKRSVFWNEYLSKEDILPGARPNYNFLIDPSFQGVNRLFVLPFASDGNTRNGYGYYLPSKDVTNYNVWINGKAFLDQPVNNFDRTYEELKKLTLGGGDDYTVGCLLDYDYVKETYKLIGIDLSKQKELDADPRMIQQLNFTASVPADTTMFYVLEKSKETVLDFSQGTVRVM